MSRRVWAIVLCAAGIAAQGCQKAAPPIAVTKPPVVLISQPVTEEVTDSEEFTGRTDAFQSVEVRARVSGYLDQILFVDGTETAEGAELFQIDPRSYQAEVDRTEASVVQSEAQLKRAEADHRRSISLFNKGVQSREDFDRITGDFEVAKAAIGIAKANRDLAKLNLGFTKVTAPIGGLLSRKQVDKGNLVKSDDTILTTIVRLDPMYVYFDVDERTLLRIRRLISDGRVQSRSEAEVPVNVGFADEEGFPHTGKIDFSENRVDPSTGTLRIRGVISNPKMDPNKPRFLSPGLFVRTRLPLGKPHKSLMIPEQAVGTDQGRKFVYVVNAKNEVSYRQVEVGLLNKGLRVIDKGLVAGENVVVSGVQRIRPGLKVEPKLADATLRAPAPKPAAPPGDPKAKAAAASASVTPAMPGPALAGQGSIVVTDGPVAAARK